MLTAFALPAGTLLPGAAFAHGVPEGLHFDPLGAAAVALLGATLAAGAIRLWGRLGPGRGLRLPQAASLAGALALLWAALVWPLEPLAETSAAAHMGQHMLLILGVPPLLLIGRAGAMTLHGLPRALGRGLGGATRGLRGLWRWLCRPEPAFVLHLAVLWTWHAPAAFEAALRSYWIHVAEHATLLGTGIMLWSSVVAAARSSGPHIGAATIVLLGTLMHTGMLGALLTFAPEPIYPSYRDRGIERALADQQLAGLVMWVPGGFVYLIAVMAAFGTWLRRAERGAPRR